MSLQLYLDQFPKEILIYHIFPNLKLKHLMTLKQVSEFLNNILKEDITYRILSGVKYPQIDHDILKPNGMWKLYYTKLNKSIIVPLYYYSEFKCYIPLYQERTNLSYVDFLKRYMMSEYPDTIAIIPNDQVNKKLIRYKLKWCYYLFDHDRKSIHLVDPSSNLVIKSMNHQSDYGQYNTMTNVCYKLRSKLDDGTTRILKKITNDKLIKELIDEGKYI